MVSADAAVYGWSAGSGGYIIVRRSAADDSAAAIDWQGSAEGGIGTSANVGGTWWNALLDGALPVQDDLAERTGLSVPKPH